MWDNEAGIGRGGRLAEGVAGFCGTLATRLVQAHPYDPETKGIVERANQYLETSFLPGRVFVSPADFNSQLEAWLPRANARHVRALGARPVDLVAADRAAMLPLPPVPPTVGARWLTRLGRDYYVRAGGNDYSADPAVIGRLVETVIERVRVTITDPAHVSTAQVLRRRFLAPQPPPRGSPSSPTQTSPSRFISCAPPEGVVPRVVKGARDRFEDDQGALGDHHREARGSVPPLPSTAACLPADGYQWQKFRGRQAETASLPAPEDEAAPALAGLYSWWKDRDAGGPPGQGAVDQNGPPDHHGAAVWTRGSTGPNTLMFVVGLSGVALSEALSAISSTVGMWFLAAAALLRCLQLRWLRTTAIYVVADERPRLRWYTRFEIREEPWPKTAVPPAGAEVTVYYHARHPDRWSLTTPHRPAWLLLGIGGVLTAASWLLPFVVR